MVCLVLLKQQSGSSLQSHKQLDQLLSLLPCACLCSLLPILYWNYSPCSLSWAFVLPTSKVSIADVYIILILNLAIGLALVNGMWAEERACQFRAKALRILQCFHLLLLYFCHLPWAEYEHPPCSFGPRMKKTCGADLNPAQSLESSLAHFGTTKPKWDYVSRSQPAILEREKEMLLWVIEISELFVTHHDCNNS